MNPSPAPSPARICFDRSLWIVGALINRTQRNSRSETATLQARGVEIYFLEGAADTTGNGRLRERLTRSDEHVVLSRLMPADLELIRPLLEQRGNYSIVVEDWWNTPTWALQHSESIIFRNYNGIAVRTGLGPFLAAEPPLFSNPLAQVSRYTMVASLMRPAVLAAAPFVDARRRAARKAEQAKPPQYFFLPYPVNAADVPLRDEKLQFDFANTGGAFGTWLVRDPFVSFKYTFANLYCDRQRLIEHIQKFENNPFSFYDWRRLESRWNRSKLPPYEEYAKKNQQAKFLVTSGGLHNSSVPKFLEYACVGTPMIGRGLRFEYPWLKDCLYAIEDIMDLSPAETKKRLHEALDLYPKMRENCLNWRDKLLHRYDLNRLLDFLQAQADGKPMPPEYLTDAARAGSQNTHR